MNPAGLLAKAPPHFEDSYPITIYTPTKLRDVYGYQYLIKGNPQTIRGSIHRESYLENNEFGRFGGDSSIISTNSELGLGWLVEHNGKLYAVESQNSYNDVMNLKHYVLKSLYDYYADFIVDTQEQANRILGANSMRYFLAFEPTISNAVIIPSRFEATENNQIRVDILSTQTIGIPYKNKDGFIEQRKKDMCVFWSYQDDTNALQEFLFDFFNNAKDLGFSNFPFWEKEERYNKEFDLRANLWRCDFEVFYSIVTTNALSDDKLITKIGFVVNGNKF